MRQMGVRVPAGSTTSPRSAVKHGFNCIFAGPVQRFRGACSEELLWFHLCQLLVALCRSSTNKLRSGGSGDKRFLSEAKAVLWGSGGHQPPPSGDFQLLALLLDDC